MLRLRGSIEFYILLLECPIAHPPPQPLVLVGVFQAVLSPSFLESSWSNMRSSAAAFAASCAAMLASSGAFLAPSLNAGIKHRSAARSQKGQVARRARRYAGCERVEQQEQQWSQQYRARLPGCVWLHSHQPLSFLCRPGEHRSLRTGCFQVSDHVE